MSTDIFYAMRIVFCPEPKVEQKEHFSTQHEAQCYIDSFFKPGDIWVIIRETSGNFFFVKGRIFQSAP